MIFYFLLIFLFSLVAALPPVGRDVWTPHITTPTNTTVWVVGCTYNVTWDTSSKPRLVSNPVGQLYLRHKNVTQTSPIVQGFKLAAGIVAVTIPKGTKPDTNWQIVLFGDSGNWSPPFKIAKSNLAGSGCPL